METARGAVPSVSQTARGAPPRRWPPSVAARMRRASVIHACATGFPSQVRAQSRLLSPLTPGKLIRPVAKRLKEAGRPRNRDRPQVKRPDAPLSPGLTTNDAPLRALVHLSRSFTDLLLAGTGCWHWQDPRTDHAVTRAGRGS